MKFDVIREHTGDREYRAGDTREAARSDVEHLIPHVLSPAAEKAETPHLNKAEAAHADKADNGRKATKAAKRPEGE